MTKSVQDLVHCPRSCQQERDLEASGHATQNTTSTTLFQQGRLDEAFIKFKDTNTLSIIIISSLIKQRS